METKLRYKGSVKDIYHTNKAGSILFDFSDRYSIFDWGEMPDLLIDKGTALASICKTLYQYLESPKTYSNLITPRNLTQEGFLKLKQTKSYNRLITSGQKHHLTDSTSKSNQLIVDAVHVIRPTLKNNTYDYSNYKLKPIKTLIPLEIVFRFGTPSGSSFLKRNSYKDYNIDRPIENSMLSNIVVEFYTKLEPIDRLLTYAQAKEIAGLTEVEFNDLVNTTKVLAIALENIFNKSNTVLWDGKFEFALGNKNNDGDREIILVDTIGPDELRITSGKLHLSKEYLRGHYKNKAWSKEIEKTKKEYGKEFKKHTLSTPSKLPPNIKENAELIYKHLANQIAINCHKSPIFKLDKCFSSFLQDMEKKL